MWLARSNAALTLRGPALELLDELVHAMGQPLTGLQMCRVLAMKGAADAEVLGDLAGQVESATEVYRALRMLLEASEGEAETMEVGAMVRRMEADWGRRVDRRGAMLRVEVGESSGRVMGGVGLEQGLDQVFEAVLREVLAGTEREVTVRASGAEVVFGGGESGAQIRETWTLRVARLLIENAGGCVVYSGHPVCVRVRFARA